MAVWKYKNHHAKYPVKDGDIVCVGNHIFVCGDLTKDTKLDLMLDLVRPDLMYVDPPWNDGNARAFRTKAGVDGEKGKKVSCYDLHIQLLERAKRLKLLVYLEGGIRETEMVKQAIAATGGKLRGEWNITYCLKPLLPCKLYCADYTDNNPPICTTLEGLDEYDTCQEIFGFHKPRVVTDPCHGRGWIARVANAMDIQAVTSELSPYRMADAIGFLVADIKKATGKEPPIDWLR